MSAIRLLNELAEFQSAQALLGIQKQEQIDLILTPEIRAEIADIDYEFQMKGEAVAQNILFWEQKVKDEVLKEGATVRGANLMAVWSKPRVSWDGKLLEGMMAVIPQLKSARSEGLPSVSIRKI
jgi:hypothetical protein